MNTTEIGKIGEKLAARYLKKNGYKICDKNVHQSHNEIDIIAVNKVFIVFAEVKTRSVSSDGDSLPYGVPSQAVTKAKQTRLIKAANDYLLKNQSRKISNKQPRLDVIEVYLDKETKKLLKINHITDAFSAR